MQYPPTGPAAAVHHQKAQAVTRGAGLAHQWAYNGLTRQCLSASQAGSQPQNQDARVVSHDTTEEH